MNENKGMDKHSDMSLTEESISSTTSQNACDQTGGKTDQNSGEEKRHLSHKKWRALVRKQKRKEKRQAEARAREVTQAQVEKSPDTLAREALQERQQKVKEEYEEKLRISQHLHWLDRERRAQEEFKLKQERIAREKLKREEEENKIREEWEKREKEEKKQQQEEVLRKERQEELLKEATKHEKKPGESPWHNPLAPEIRPGIERDPCPFYVKVGACRFGDRCSRTHQYPDSSTTLLFPGMYSHFKLEHSLKDEYDTDMGLEYEDSETYQHFREFFQDTLPEFQKYGKVVQFKVCCNEEPHLRGNVYVQFADEASSLQALMHFNGRWYGGRQLNCQLCVVEKWRHAICGVFAKNRCPKGRNCNFIHAFRNPGNMFWEADRDLTVHERNRRDRYDRHSPSRSPSRTSSRSMRRSRSPYSRSSRSHRSSSRMSSRKHRKRSRSPRSRSRSPVRRSRSPRKRSRSPRNRSKSPKLRASSPRNRSRSPRKRSRSRSPGRSKRHKRSRSPDRTSTASRTEKSRHSRSPKRYPGSSGRRRRRSRERSLSRSPDNRRLAEKSSKKRSRRSSSSEGEYDENVRDVKHELNKKTKQDRKLSSNQLADKDTRVTVNGLSEPVGSDSLNALFCETPPYVDVDTTPEYVASADLKGEEENHVHEKETMAWSESDQEAESVQHKKYSTEQKDRKKNDRKKLTEHDVQKETRERSHSRDRSNNRNYRKYKSHPSVDGTDSSSSDEKSSNRCRRMKEKKSKKKHRSIESDRRDRSPISRQSDKHSHKLSKLSSHGDKSISRASESDQSHNLPAMLDNESQYAKNEAADDMSGSKECIAKEIPHSDKNCGNKKQKSKNVLKKLSFKVKKQTEKSVVAANERVLSIFQEELESDDENVEKTEETDQNHGLVVSISKSAERNESIHMGTSRYETSADNMSLTSTGASEKFQRDQLQKGVDIFDVEGSEMKIFDSGDRSKSEAITGGKRSDVFGDISEKNCSENKAIAETIIHKDKANDIGETVNRTSNRDMKTGEGNDLEKNCGMSSRPGHKIADLIEQMPERNVVDKNIVSDIKNKDKALEFLDRVIADIGNE